jgi:hypothetical protein
MQLAEERAQITLRITRAMLVEIEARAKEYQLSVNRTLVQLLQSGIEAERNKKRHLENLLHRYRESKDPQEIQRLGDELGAMIFG